MTSPSKTELQILLRFFELQLILTLLRTKHTPGTYSCSDYNFSSLFDFFAVPVFIYLSS